MSDLQQVAADVDAAITLTMVTMDVEAGFGLLSFYSSVADVAAIIMVVAVLVVLVTVAVVVVTMVTAVNGSSFFLFSSAAVAEITVPAANSYRRRSLRRLLT